MKYVVNEEQDAKHILKEGVIMNNAYKTIQLLIKYYYLNEGLKKKQVENKINEFLLEHYEDYDVVSTPDTIESLLNSYWRNKKNYTKVKSIKITKSELEFIRKADNIILEKIMFVLLVDAKKNNQATNGKTGKWTHRGLDDILKDAKLHGTYRRKYLQTYKVTKLKGIRSGKKVNSDARKILFMDLNEDSEVVIELVDMRNYVYEYLRWRGENIGNCEVCGIRIKQNIHNQKYCKQCLRDKQKKWNRMSMRKTRDV